MKNLLTFLIAIAVSLVSQAQTVKVTSHVDVSCFGKNDGSVTVTMTGGTGSLTYAWSSGQTTKTITNLAPTTYTVTITDMTSTSATTAVTITQPTALIANAGSNSAICSGTSTTLKSGLTTGGTSPYTSTWSGGSNVVSPLVLTTYTLTVTDKNACTATSQVTVSVNALPTVSLSSLASVYCKNAPAITMVGSPVGGIFNDGTMVMKDTVLVPLNDSIFNPSTKTAGNKTITYTFTDGNGCVGVASHTTTILDLPSAPQICMVTVDTLSKHNLIIWDKTAITNVDSFIVYREITNNVYQQVGAVGKHQLSEFVDTVESKFYPNTGNPNTASYRYKLGLRDTCGNYSPMGNYHNTIFTTQISAGTFTWNDYKIEGQSIPVATLSAYVLYRDDNSTGVWHSVNSVAASQNTMTDPNFASYPNASWRVETQWSIGCVPTMKANQNFFASRSNINKHNITTGIDNKDVSTGISVYPNPFDKQTKVSISLTAKADVKIVLFNSLGQEVSVIENKVLENGDYTYDLSVENKGVYFLTSTVNGKVSTKRIIQLN